MIELKLIQNDDDLYADFLELRNQVLRLPIGLNLYNEDLNKEKNQIKIVAI